MSFLPQKNTEATTEERYRMLKSSLANYLLLQVSTFIDGAGINAVSPAMEILTQKSAELKARRIRENGSRNLKESMVGLSNNLAESMGETFQSDYAVSEEENKRTVNLKECGCIKSVLEISDNYGINKPQARSIFCGSCINSYKKTAGILKLGFDGRLTQDGCVMSFSAK